MTTFTNYADGYKFRAYDKLVATLTLDRKTRCWAKSWGWIETYAVITPSGDRHDFESKDRALMFIQTERERQTH